MSRCPALSEPEGGCHADGEDCRRVRRLLGDPCACGKAASAPVRDPEGDRQYLGLRLSREKSLESPGVRGSRDRECLRFVVLVVPSDRFGQSQSRLGPRKPRSVARLALLCGLVGDEDRIGPHFGLGAACNVFQGEAQGVASGGADRESRHRDYNTTKLLIKPKGHLRANKRLVGRICQLPALLKVSAFSVVTLP